MITSIQTMTKSTDWKLNKLWRDKLVELIKITSSIGRSNRGI